MKKLICSIFIACFLCCTVFAQYENIALRLSDTYSGGTARFLGLGGAHIALGADMSCLTGNPAGLAFYKKSDFMFSPSLRFSSSDNTFLGTSQKSTKENFNFANAGFVFGTPELGEGYGWQNFAFGMGFNKVNNFHLRNKLEGANTKNSISDFFTEKANSSNTHYNDMNNAFPYQNMAYWVYLLDPDTINDKSGYTYKGLVRNGGVKQYEETTTEGSMDEWAFAFAANYNQKFYMGAGLSLVTARFREERYYVEADEGDTIIDFNKFSLNELRSIDGTGTTFKLGVTFRPIDWIRFGGVVQTPTYFNLNEKTNRDMNFEIDSKQEFLNSKAQEYDFNLTTPYRYNLGLAIFMGNFGFISADYEQVDYRENDLSAAKTDFNFTENNTKVSSMYQAASNLRIGTEIKMGNYHFRTGYAIYGDAYKSVAGGLNLDRNRRALSGGFGIKQDGYYFDIALINTRFKDAYSPYTLKNNTQPVSTNTNSVNTFVFTMGMTF